ncbi:hypothetical protein [Streptomyces sp. NPDC002559]
MPHLVVVQADLALGGLEAFLHTPADTGESPWFDAGEVEGWLWAHGKLATGLTTVSCSCGEAGAAPRRSPLAEAGEAKRRRDLGAEVGALVGGHRALTGAPWYPSRPGDQLLVTMEAAGQSPCTTELYEVTAIEGGLELRLVEVAPEGAAGGWYAGPPEEEILSEAVVIVAVDGLRMLHRVPTTDSKEADPALEAERCLRASRHFALVAVLASSGFG